MTRQLSRKKTAGAVKELGDFLLLKKLGEGGMGQVYLARQQSMDRDVALKVLSPDLIKDLRFIKQFLREARAAGSLTHGNVVQVHDVGEAGGSFYLCMEYVSGGTLADLLKLQGRLEPDTAVRVALDTARGLAFAELKGIVHCDIKPENIMITDTGVAKVADLGIARRVSAQSDKPTDEVLGSPHYMAPEQARGKPVDHRTDIYALGCTLFRMLTGRTVFTGATSREVMKKQVGEKAPDIRQLVPEISSKLAAIIAKSLAKEPAERQQSLNELVAELEEALQAGVVRKGGRPKGGTRAARLVGTGQGETATRRLRAVRKRGSNLSVVLTLVLLAAIFGGGFFYIKTHLKPLAEEQIEQAQQLMEQEDFAGALRVLESIPRSTDAVAEKVNPLIKEAKLRQQEQEAAAKWRQVWEEYQQKKRGGATPEQLRAEAEALLKQYGTQNPEWRALLMKELKKTGGAEDSPRSKRKKSAD